MAPIRYHKGKFPPSDGDLDWSRIVPKIGPATGAITQFDGLLHGVPNPDVLLAPLNRQEAVLSSRIEGTQATLGEVLEFEATGDPDDESSPKKADIREILNYRRALRAAASSMEQLPLSNRLIRQSHDILMDGVRGRNKDPGQFRRIPNWIGAEGSPVEAARFVPCDVEELPDAMGAWERYLHDPAPDVLVQLAIAHAEFEAIHPFLDGNGRLGRLLIPLFLWEKKLISSPNFYLSEFLEAHRDAYYDRLLGISAHNDWTGWICFFLEAAEIQAKANTQKAKNILNLYSNLKDQIVAETRSQYAVRALDWFFDNPAFRTPTFLESADIPTATARNILRKARDSGIVQEIAPGSGQRPSLYYFRKLVALAEGRDISG